MFHHFDKLREIMMQFPVETLILLKSLILLWYKLFCQGLPRLSL